MPGPRCLGLPAPRRRALRVWGALLVAAVICAAAPASSSAEKSYFYPEISMTITFAPDGTADVDEIRTFSFDGSFSWAKLEKDVQGQYGRYRVEYLDVSDADTGERFRTERLDRSGYDVIKWYYSARDETRRFRIRYRVHGAVQRYGDAAQFYWKVIGEEHERIERLRVTLLPPAPSESLMKVFVHGPGVGRLDIADDRSRAAIAVDGVPRNRFVEIRALMDPSLFGAAGVQGGESHASLLEDEKRITERWRRAEERRLERNRRRGGELRAALILGGMMIAAFVIVYIRFFRVYGREYDVGYTDRYERKPPRDIPPCYLPAIMTQSGAKAEEMGKAFMAALLECARLGCLEIRERVKEGLIFKQKDFEYELTALGREILAGRREAVRRETGHGDPGGSGGGLNGGTAGSRYESRAAAGPTRPLTFFERDVLEAVFIEAGDGTKATGDGIKKWASGKSGAKTEFYRFVEERGKRMRREFEREHFPLDDPASERAKKRFFGITALIAVVPAAVFLAVTRNPVFLPIPLWIIIVGAILTLPLARRTREAALEHERWTAFKRFMTDFSAMKDAGVSLLPLWEHYLVYAAALGVAEKLLKNLELVAHEYGTVVPAAVWFHSAAGAGIGGAAGAAFESVGASIANLQALSSALSTTTSSGGGFSGGGGGGGGGGGSSAG
jgi:uncharacterized membrane protein